MVGLLFTNSALESFFLNHVKKSYKGDNPSVVDLAFPIQRYAYASVSIEIVALFNTTSVLVEPSWKIPVTIVSVTSFDLNLPSQTNLNLVETSGLMSVFDCIEA